MQALQKWLEKNVRGESWGIMRCERLGGSSFSLHAEGRAIDWHLDARRSKDRRAAMRLIRTLLAGDRNGEPAALARRMGVQGLIFNCKSWWSGQDGLGKYSYCYRREREEARRHRPHPGPQGPRPPRGQLAGRAQAHQLLAQPAAARRNVRCRAAPITMCPLEMNESRSDDRRVGSPGTQVGGSRARVLVTLGLVALALGAVGIATAEMRSTKLGPRLCETTGGGRFVRIPDFRGEKIDRRLLNDVAYLRERFKIFVTDGYSLDPVHSRNGEHPIGLALDIVPDFANGGNWRKITRLAEWAEPRQDRPRPPFRWVGYNGDAGHGRGHHLHLSFSHSNTRYNRPARMMQGLKCPGKPEEPAKPTSGDGDRSSGSGGVGYSQRDLERVRPENGGIGLQ